ncbi:MAG: ChaN family lipoprotein [Pseudomonadota bacterium]
MKGPVGGGAAAGRPLARGLAVLATAGLAACAAPAGEEQAVFRAVSLVGEAPAEAPGARPPSGIVWDVEAGRAIDPSMLVERLSAADIAILGEVHDNALHHERQAWLIAALDPVGVAFEQVPQGSERGIAVWREQGGASGGIGPAIGWSRLGWPDWALYRPVFEASANAVITGGGVARRELAEAMSSDAAAAYGAGAAAVGLDQPLSPPAQAEVEAEMVASHCDMLPAEMAGPMVEAQRLRDARFAAATLRARDLGIAARETGDGLNPEEVAAFEGAAAPPRAVLVTGNGHARRDRGVPLYLATLAPGLETVSLGQVEVLPGRDTPAEYGAPYDYVWFSSPVIGRPDPCEAFRNR